MKLFKRNKRKKETIEEISERIIKLTNGGDYGIFPPPLNAQVALNELCRYILGEDFYIVNPLNNEQANIEIVIAIENKLKNLL
jgi:hypothetical protein